MISLKNNIIQGEKKEEIGLMEIKNENEIISFFKKILSLIFKKGD